MHNVETRNMNVAENGALLALLNKARLEEKRDQHLAMSVHIAKLTIQIQQQGMSVSEVIELLNHESERFEHSAQELRA